MKRLLLVIGIIIVAMLALAFVASAGEAGIDTCPSGGDWIKIEPLSGTSYTYTAPAGRLVAEVCYKAGDTVVKYLVTPPTQTVTVNSTVWNKPECPEATGCNYQDLSHASFRLVNDEVDITYDTWFRNDCTAVYYRGRVLVDGQVVKGPFSLGQHFWTDPYLLETAPAKSGTFNVGYGSMSFSFDPISEREHCLEQNDGVVYAVVDCKGWKIVYKASCESEEIIIDSGVWKDLTTNESFSRGGLYEGIPYRLEIIEPQDCDKPCVPEHVFVWFHESGCNLRQFGGPIGGQKRPFVPMQSHYCCPKSIYPTDEGWTGRYINSCQRTEEFTYWNELPQFNRPFVCE
jgi:hypothetical protein